MKVDEAEEYTQALGQSVSGAWRQIALGERLGVPKALGLTTREWVDGRLGGYVRLSIPERREAVAELKAEGMSQRQTAAVLGVNQATVSNDLRADENSSSDPLNQAVETPAADENSSPPRERVAALPPDLAERVDEGMSLDEAEQIVVDRQKRIEAYVKRVRGALDLFSRMVGHPVPAALTAELDPSERKALRAVLEAITTTEGERDAAAAA